MSRSEDEILEEMLRWLKFTGMQQAREVIDEALTFEDDEQREKDSRIAYELTNGEYNQREISECISYSRATVGNWQDKWSKLGIVERDSDYSPYEHLVSLSDLGLQRPEIPDPNEEAESEEDEQEDQEAGTESDTGEQQATIDATAEDDD